MRGRIFTDVVPGGSNHYPRGATRRSATRADVRWRASAAAHTPTAWQAAEYGGLFAEPPNPLRGHGEGAIHVVVAEPGEERVVVAMSAHPQRPELVDGQVHGDAR